MLFEPQANAVFNLNNFLKISIGGSYRFMFGVALTGLSDSDMSGPTLSAKLHFGSF